MGRSSDGGGGSSSGSSNEWGSLVVDIACVAPAEFVDALGSGGLVQLLKGGVQQSGRGNCSSQLSSGSSRTDSGSCSGGDVLLAVEVDGPSHVSVNCWDHALGSSISRSWLLQQQGWSVLEVPWWQWDAA